MPLPENEIVGEALIALKHEELKELGMNSVGHRLTLLKNVYETTIKQDIPIDPDHYVPLCKLNSDTSLFSPDFLIKTHHLANKNSRPSCRPESQRGCDTQ
jgi:hypothetical protein